MTPTTDSTGPKSPVAEGKASAMLKTDGASLPTSPNNPDKSRRSKE